MSLGPLHLPLSFSNWPAPSLTATAQADFLVAYKPPVPMNPFQALQLDAGYGLLTTRTCFTLKLNLPSPYYQSLHLIHIIQLSH